MTGSPNPSAAAAAADKAAKPPARVLPARAETAEMEALLASVDKEWGEQEQVTHSHQQVRACVYI